MLKTSMEIFFNNLNLALMQQYLTYKNINKIQLLLIKPPYGKVTWWIKHLNIHLIIADMALKKYLIYFLNIIFTIYFLINYYYFASYMVYTPNQCSLINNLKTPKIVTKNKQIYRKMHIVN